MQYPVYRGKNSTILSFECEVLKMKNTQILESGFYSTSKLLDSCIRKEHGFLISEMYGVWRNPNHTTLQSLTSSDFKLMVELCYKMMQNFIIVN